MAVKYSIETMKVGFGTDKKDAYVGRVQLGDTIDTDMLVEQISLRTGMAEAQIKMVLENMTKSIQHFCKIGNGVRLGKLGIIKPKIQTRSAETEEDVQVVKLKYSFLPSTEMKEALRELEVRKLGESSENEEDEDDEEVDSSGGSSSGDGGETMT